MNNNQEAVTQAVENNEEIVETHATEKKEEVKAEKTFTQSDLNRLEMKLENKFKEKYKGYDEWLETQKTEAEKKEEQTRKQIERENENKALKQEIALLKSDVSKDFIGYVQYEVSKMDGEFEENLVEFLKSNPKYLQKQETKPSDTGVAVKNSTTEDSGVSAILKNKHPEIF